MSRLRAGLGLQHTAPRVILRRYAHAARRIHEEEDKQNRAGPSDVKGKRRARPEPDSYRFPAASHGRQPDPFQVMNLDRSASADEVKQQYYRLARLLHPDSSHPSASKAHFATLNKAYTLLSNQKSREAYERVGTGWANERDVARAEAMFRGRAAAATRRNSEAGRGAWGYWGMDGKWQPFPEANVGEREPVFENKGSAWALIVLAFVSLGWYRYHSIDAELGTRMTELANSHESASAALASARREAKMFGLERREQIKRRVNESRVLKELETVESEGSSHNALLLPGQTASTSEEGGSHEPRFTP